MILPHWSWYCLLVHGEAGGDGQILADLSGDAWLDIGASLLSAEKDGLTTAPGDCNGWTVELKLSRGLASGGDIRLEMGGRRVMVVNTAWRWYLGNEDGWGMAVEELEERLRWMECTRR